MRYAFVVKCVSAEKDAGGKVTVIHCTYDPTTRSGTTGAEARKVKGNIHWLSVAHARAPKSACTTDCSWRRNRTAAGRRFSGAPTVAVEVDDDVVIEEAIERNYLDDLNPRGKEVVAAYVEPSLADVAPEARYQFERHGYFVADMRDSQPGAAVFNRAVTLRDSWGHKSARP